MPSSKKKYRNTISPFIIVIVVMIIAIIAISVFLKSGSTNSQNSPAILDNSPMGVVNNFYQWYTSCMGEGQEDEAANVSIKTCYQKTTYLSQNLVKEIDMNQKSILCNKDLGFHTVLVKTNLQGNDKDVINIFNSKTNGFVAKATTEMIKNSWQITDISCTP